MAIRFPQYDLPPDLLNSRISGAMATCGDEVGPILFGDFFDTAPATVTGTMAVTEGVDTFSASGDVFVVGAMAASESGADVATMGGDVIVQGLLAATEQGADECVASGQVVVSGTMDAIEQGQDSFSATSQQSKPVKRGGVPSATKHKPVKRLEYTVENESDKRAAVERILSGDDAPAQVIKPTAATPRAFAPALRQPQRPIDLTPVISAASRATAAEVRALVEDAIRREAERVAIEEARANEIIQQAIHAAHVARMRDEDEAAALIFIMATA